jgi:hypothetical protein
MKLSSSLLAIVFSILGVTLGAQGRGLEFFLSESRNVRSIENKLHYQIFPFKQAFINISSQNTSEKRINFDQVSRLSRLGMDLTIQSHKLAHTIYSGYEYQFDSSNLEEELSPYSNRTGFLGYGIAYEPLDSLRFQAGVKGYLRKEQDRYVSEHTLGSEGLLYYASGNLFLANNLVFGGLRAGVEGKEMDWERYLRASLNASLNLESDRLVFFNSINLDKQTDDLYILSEGNLASGAGQYLLSDVQSRNSITYNAFAEYNPDLPIKVMIGETYSQRVTDFDNNLVRSNADYLNLAELKLDYGLKDNIVLQGRAAHTLAIKDFNYSRNTRHSEFRTLNTTAAWEYIPGDSLTLSYQVELQRTSYPDDANRWDNDLLTETLRVGNVHYWNYRTRIQSWLVWSQKEDVYIKAILSSNNKTVNSISFQPDCTFLIGDRIAIQQSYWIRADYTDYHYEGNTAGLYRQLGCKYNLTFDSFPFIARSGDPVWLGLPYRNGGENAFLADLGFSFEQNEYADKIEDYYSIVTKNRKYSAFITLKHDIRSLYYILEPKYTWGTWKEYSLLFGLAWQFNDRSLLEMSLNPVGESPDDLDWRINLSMNLQF